MAARAQRRSDLVLGRPHLPARSRAPAAAIGHEVRDVRAAWIRRYENFRIDDTIHVPQMYLLSVGHKQR